MIEVKNLTKRYNEFTVLNDISFTVEKGEIFAYLGPNGAGKTTTMNILSTLIKPSAGIVKIAGYDVKKDGNNIRKVIGYMFEDLGLYPSLTITENLNFSGSMHRMEKKERIIKIQELLEFFNLKEYKENQVATLSKGMKQKVGLAKTLMHDPQILFLDELTSGLDPFMAQEVIDLIKKLKREKKTIIISTHLLNRAEKVCDTVGLINRGNLLDIGRIDEVKDRLKSTSLEDVYFKVMGEIHG